MTPTPSQDPPIPQGGGGLMLWPWPWQGGWGGDPEPGTYILYYIRLSCCIFLSLIYDIFYLYVSSVSFKWRQFENDLPRSKVQSKNVKKQWNTTYIIWLNIERCSKLLSFLLAWNVASCKLQLPKVRGWKTSLTPSARNAWIPCRKLGSQNMTP